VKDVKIFEDGLHEIHHDHGKDVFQSLITNFLEERMKASPKPIGKSSIPFFTLSRRVSAPESWLEGQRSF
jgi:hypothetical protein